MEPAELERLRRHVKRCLRRELRRRVDQCGLIVVGRFPLFRFTNRPYAAHTVGVGIGSVSKGLDNVRPGPIWFELNPGTDYEVSVLFSGLGRRGLRSRRFRAGNRPKVLFLEPPLRSAPNREPTIEIVDQPESWLS